MPSGVNQQDSSQIHVPSVGGATGGTVGGGGTAHPHESEIKEPTNEHSVGVKVPSFAAVSMAPQDVASSNFPAVNKGGINFSTSVTSSPSAQMEHWALAKRKSAAKATKSWSFIAVPEG